mgnify:CR=1 FL=1
MICFSCPDHAVQPGSASKESLLRTRELLRLRPFHQEREEANGKGSPIEGQVRLLEALTPSRPPLNLKGARPTEERSFHMPIRAHAIDRSLATMIRYLGPAGNGPKRLFLCRSLRGKSEEGQ